MVVAGIASVNQNRSPALNPFKMDEPSVDAWLAIRSTDRKTASGGNEGIASVIVAICPDVFGATCPGAEIFSACSKVTGSPSSAIIVSSTSEARLFKLALKPIQSLL